MEAKDLMIGDWVIHPYYKHPSKIVYFNGSRVRVEYEEVEAESLRPIPLTPEILKKNGWEERPKGYVLYKKLCKNTFVVNTADIQIKYVHELQHALRLCGITREIII